jgi:hypothetical protein
VARVSASEPIRVELSELRRVSTLLFDQLEKTVGSEVILEKDFYWAVEPDDKYNPYDQPSNFSLGQLSECLTNIKSMSEENVLSFGLVWLSSLLMIIGEIVVE